MDKIDINQTVSKLQFKIKTKNLVESDVIEFFTLFETDFLMEYEKTDDWWSEATAKLKSQDLKVMFFIPFMEYIFSENHRLREVFIEECHRRTNNGSDSFALIKIIEIFLYEADIERLSRLFKGYEEKLFTLFYKIIKNIDPYKRYSSSFWPFGFAEKIGTVLSPAVKRKVAELIINEQFDEILFLSREQFLQSLNLIDFIRIILDPALDFINFIITKTAELKDKYDLYEHGIDIPGSDRNTQFISKKLMDILNEVNDDKTDALIGLCLHSHIHFRDFVALPQEVKKHFFVTAHRNNRFYQDGERQNLDWQLGQIKYLESGCIYDHIAEVIKKGVIEEIRDLFWENWFSLLSAEDFINLWDDPEINLYDIILKINRDLNRSLHEFGIYVPRDLMELLKGRIGEKIRETINKGDEQEVVILFLLEFFDYLNEDELSSLIENLNFVGLIYKLDRHCWESPEADKIHEFFNKYQPLINKNLKQIVINNLKSGDIKEIFTIWEYRWLSSLSENELCEILAMQDLRLLGNLLKAIHSHGYKKNYDHTSALFHLLDHFITMSSRIRNALKPHVREVIKSGDMEAIVPLIGSHYLEILDINEIISLIYDSKVELLKLINKVTQEHRSELFYFNEDFFSWVDKFNNLLQKFGLNSISRPGSLLELIYQSRYSGKSKHYNEIYGKNVEYVKIAGVNFYIKNGILDLRNLFLQDISKIKGLFSLKTIKTLDLSDNWITEIPKNIHQLQSLEKLIIVQSRLHKLPEAISKLKNLEILDLEWNYLKALPESLFECESLEYIKLSKYKYHDLPLLEDMIKRLRDKGIEVSIQDMHFLG